MKKTFIAAFCIVGFLFIAGGAIIEERPNPVFINGKPFGNAFMINGVIAISVADLANAVSGTPNLHDAGFRLVGTKLSTVANTWTGTHAHGGGGGAGKVHVHDIVIHKTTDISSAVVMKEGKPFVPLVDVVHAFDPTYSFNQTSVRRGAPINLNFAVNGDGALAVAPHP